jgi:hypothetical protein
MDLSVIAFIKLAASGDKLGLDGATNLNFCLQQQTRPVLGEIPPAQKLDIQLSVLLYRLSSVLNNSTTKLPSSTARALLSVASGSCGLPPLHAGVLSAA